MCDSRESKKNPASVAALIPVLDNAEENASVSSSTAANLTSDLESEKNDITKDYVLLETLGSGTYGFSTFSIKIIIFSC